MNSEFRAWTALLTAAAAATGAPTQPSAPGTAQEGLRLLWSTASKVRTAGNAHDGLWWIRVVETTLELANATGAEASWLRTGPTPNGWLPDTPTLRTAVDNLLAAVTAADPRYTGRPHHHARRSAAPGTGHRPPRPTAGADPAIDVPSAAQLASQARSSTPATDPAAAEPSHTPTAPPAGHPDRGRRRGR
jgi:hypothetical protein